VNADDPGTRASRQQEHNRRTRSADMKKSPRTRKVTMPDKLQRTNSGSAKSRTVLPPPIRVLRTRRVDAVVDPTNDATRLLQNTVDTLVHSQDQYRRLMTRLAVCVFELAGDGTILCVNDAASHITGYHAVELEGKSWWNTFFCVNQRGQVADLNTRFQSGEISNYEIELRAKNSASIFLQVCSAHQYGRQDRLERIVVCGVDVTERRRADAALRGKDGQLRQALKMEAVGRLAGGIAHDFNNLLTVINGFSELVLTRESLDSKVRHEVEQVRECGLRAAMLTRQLLAFSRAQVLEPTVLNLNDVVCKMESLLRRLIGEDIALCSHLDPALTPVTADPGQLDQVMMNLAVNARDAMPRGGRLLIETKNVELDEAYTQIHRYVRPGAYVMLAVSDNGEGIDPAVQSHIFEPFFTTKGQEQGTGLGLSTVYGIVKQSGGSIEVYSEVRHGTTFKIYLPTSAGHGKATEDVPGSLEVLKGTETILLVEDDEKVRALARVMLERLGYVVLQACNGPEALAIYENRSGPIHLLVTDVVMPKMSGRELAERLRGQWPSIKVLYMSGFTDDAVLLHGLLRAEHAVLQKPFSSSALASSVRRELDPPDGQAGETGLPQQGPSRESRAVQ